jgi:hypothetical protein
MFALSSGSRRSPRSRRSTVAAAAIEALDPRRLMSVSVPAGYVQVASLTLDAVSLAAQSIDVTAGHDYFFKATGKHVLAQGPNRYADAASYEPTANSWSDGTHLHVRLGGVDVASWGAHASDNEYGASYTPAADASLSAVITDGNPSDNGGSLNLTVYERVDLVSLTVTSVGGGVASATDYDGTADTLSVAVYGANQATVDVSAAVTPDSDSPRGMAVWAAYDAEGGLLGGDTFDAGDDSITFTFASSTDTFTIRAGIDLNGNGVLDAGSETTRTLIIQQE